MLDATNQNLQEEKKEEISVKTPQVEGSVSSEKQEESLQKDLKLEEKFDKSTEPQEVRNTASEDTKSELNQVEEIAPEDTISELKQAETTVSIEVEEEVLTKANTKEETLRFQKWKLWKAKYPKSPSLSQNWI